jgi:glycosyltransferase involved in cell wall biosynthesis
MPTFVAEGMMFSKICVCSEFTGTASLIENNKNGFVYDNNSPEELAGCIEKIVSNFEKLCFIGQEARRTYEKNLSIESFKENLKSVVANLCKNT